MKSGFGFLNWNPPWGRISRKGNPFSDFAFDRYIRNPDFPIERNLVTTCDFVSDDFYLPVKLSVRPKACESSRCDDKHAIVTSDGLPLNLVSWKMAKYPRPVQRTFHKQGSNRDWLFTKIFLNTRVKISPKRRCWTAYWSGEQSLGARSHHSWARIDFCLNTWLGWKIHCHVFDDVITVDVTRTSGILGNCVSTYRLTGVEA